MEVHTELNISTKGNTELEIKQMNETSSRKLCKYKANERTTEPTFLKETTCGSVEESLCQLAMATLSPHSLSLRSKGIPNCERNLKLHGKEESAALWQEQFFIPEQTIDSQVITVAMNIITEYRSSPN